MLDQCRNNAGALVGGERLEKTHRLDEALVAFGIVGQSLRRRLNLLHQQMTDGEGNLDTAPTVGVPDVLAYLGVHVGRQHVIAHPVEDFVGDARIMELGDADDGHFLRRDIRHGAHAIAHQRDDRFGRNPVRGGEAQHAAVEVVERENLDLLASDAAAGEDDHRVVVGADRRRAPGDGFDAPDL